MQRGLTQLAARCAVALPQAEALLGTAARQLHSSAARPDGTVQGASKTLPRQAAINRMLYRSRQRGFLELDLLIGMWAERELPALPDDQVAELEAVLDQENPDMFKWLTGQVEAPPELQGNRVFQRLRAHVKAQTDAHHSVPSRSASEAPKEWVRGWSDSGADLSSGSSSGGGGSGAKPV